MQRALAYERTPGLLAPLRFFLSAPLFALAAALLLLWQGEAALQTRWAPVTLALTHLLTLGFLASAMIGALMQILPVVAGIVLPRPNASAAVIHALLTLGTTLLAAAFWFVEPLLFKLALPCLAGAFGWLLAAAACGLWRARRDGNANPTLRTIRLALAALAVTVMLGAALAAGFAWPLRLPLLVLTDLHAAWGLLGWVGLLVIGVAFQVVPMFQVTPVYPPPLERRLAAGLLALLAAWSVAAWVGQDGLRGGAFWLGLPLALGYAGFALTTLWLLRRRKRPKPDATTWFWRAALASLLLCALLWPLQPLLPFSVAPTLGAAFIVGFGYSAVNGMLYKIVPFLVWYHLQQALERGQRAPAVKDIVPDALAQRQFVVHAAALLLLLGATLWPALLARPAALALAGSSAWLGWNLLRAARLYRRVRHRAASALVVA